MEPFAMNPDDIQLLRSLESVWLNELTSQSKPQQWRWLFDHEAKRPVRQKAMSFEDDVQKQDEKWVLKGRMNEPDVEVLHEAVVPSRVLAAWKTKGNQSTWPWCDSFVKSHTGINQAIMRKMTSALQAQEKSGMAIQRIQKPSVVQEDTDPISFITKFDRWSPRCPRVFKHGLLSIKKAQAKWQKDPEYRLVWNGLLPEHTKEDFCSEEIMVEHYITVMEKRFQLNKKTKKKKSNDNMDIVVRKGDLENLSEKDERSAFGKALWQVNSTLLQMANCEPYTISNFKIQELDMLPLQHWLHKHTMQVRHPETGISASLYPAGSFTDLHADSCTAGRAFGTGSKIFLLWPPTEHNLLLWKATLGQTNRLMRCGADLKDGIVIKIDRVMNCITMPAGTLHAVFTLEGGFLGGFNYCADQDIMLASTMIRLQWEDLRVPSQLIEDIRWYKISLEKIIEANDAEMVPVGLHSMILLLDVVDLYPTRDDECTKAIKKTAEDCWKLRKKRNGNGVQASCSCGVVLDDIQYKSHYRLEHCPCLQNSRILRTVR